MKIFFASPEWKKFKTPLRGALLESGINHKLVFYGAPNNGPFETINYLKLISEHKQFKEIVVGFNYGTDIFRIMPSWDP